MSEEEVTETLQRPRKIIRGSRKNRDSSESEETRQPSRVKWKFSEDQQKEADSRLLCFWQLIGGAASTPPNNTRELEGHFPAISS